MWNFLIFFVCPRQVTKSYATVDYKDMTTLAEIICKKKI